MLRRAVVVFARISRLDTSLIVFLSVAVPLYFRVRNLSLALADSLPLLAIAMCGFILNDIHDVERDRENHPHRPLPRKDLTETQAAALYFILLAAALTILRAFVDPEVAVLYLLLLVALINYNYVVTYFPLGKNLYVACVGVIPLLVLSLLLRQEWMTLPTMGALFAFLLGRELLMDVEDLRGDGNTPARLLGANFASVVGFSLKILSSIALVITAPNDWTKGFAISILVLDVIFASLWRTQRFRRSVLHAMKGQLAIGIAYIALE